MTKAKEGELRRGEEQKQFVVVSHPALLRRDRAEQAVQEEQEVHSVPPTTVRSQLKYLH